MEKDQPLPELLQCGFGHGEPGPGGLRIRADLDEADAAERSAQLVLDTRLQAEPLDLHAMCGLRHLERGPRTSERVERADERDRHCCGCPRRAPGRHVRGDADLDRDAVGHPDVVDHRFEQRVTTGCMSGLEAIGVAEVGHLEDDAVPDRPRLQDPHADLDARRDRDVEDHATAGEPRVGPPAQVADADRRDRRHLPEDRRPLRAPRAFRFRRPHVKSIRKTRRSRSGAGRLPRRA